MSELHEAPEAGNEDVAAVHDDLLALAHVHFPEGVGHLHVET